MANLGNELIRDANDLKRFEAEVSLEERLPERSILDVFIASANHRPEDIAITMLMTSAEDEQPRQVGYAQLLGLIRRAANSRLCSANQLPFAARQHRRVAQSI